MINIKIKRVYNSSDWTIGKLELYKDGVLKFECDTLEDANRGLRSDMPLELIKAKKVYGKTAIPSGKYQVRLTFSPKFKTIMPLLMDVKGFTGIRIHSGNDESDTEGCLLVGENKAKGKVLNSRKTYNDLMTILFKANEEEDNVITLEIN